MALTIPLRTDLFSYTQSLVLDGASVDLWLSYNTRDTRWYWSLYLTSTPFDADGGRVPIIGGLPVTVSWPFWRQFRYLASLPGGDLLALDESGQGLDPGQFDLGNRVQLYYMTAAELAALGGA
jgi:uncharacterized protein DUF6983